MSTSFPQLSLESYSTSEFATSNKVAWAWRIAAAVLLVVTGLVVTFMLASFLQWRAEVRSDSASAAQSRIAQSRIAWAMQASANTGKLTVADIRDLPR